MRIALYEMKYCPSVPDKVAINEAIEFAKEYADKTDVRFINGVLNSYYRTIRQRNSLMPDFLP